MLRSARAALAAAQARREDEDVRPLSSSFLFARHESGGRPVAICRSADHLFPCADKKPSNVVIRLREARRKSGPAHMSPPPPPPRPPPKSRRSSSWPIAPQRGPDFGSDDAGAALTSRHGISGVFAPEAPCLEHACKGPERWQLQLNAGRREACTRLP